MLDHLIWGTNDLERGIDDIEERTGVRAAHGGNHPGLGTRNALLSLGENRYLEIIAPDPAQGNVSDLAVQLAELGQAWLMSWVVRVDDMEELVVRGKEHSYPIAKVSESRRKPDGKVLRWSFATIEDRGLLPHVPGFIKWEGTAHPSQDAPIGCNLVRLEIEAQHPEDVRALLTAFRLGVDVRKGATERLKATLDTAKGRVELS